jgi:hypothetical protein
MLPRRQRKRRQPGSLAAARCALFGTTDYAVLKDCECMHDAKEAEREKAA